MATEIRDDATLIALLAQGWTPPGPDGRAVTLTRLAARIERWAGRLGALGELIERADDA